MNANFITPISMTLTSAKLVDENAEDGVGTIEFQISEQPVRIVVSTSSYTYDTTLVVGQRVTLINDYGSFGKGSSGILQSIEVDRTTDRGEVLFDNIVPNQDLFGDLVVNVLQTIVSLEYTVPLSYLTNV
jgi:hypothetical protein